MLNEIAQPEVPEPNSVASRRPTTAAANDDTAKESENDESPGLDDVMVEANADGSEPLADHGLVIPHVDDIARAASTVAHATSHAPEA